MLEGRDTWICLALAHTLRAYILSVSYMLSIFVGRTYKLVFRGTVWLHLLTTLTFMIPTINPTFRSTLALSIVPLHNAIGCRVFRLLKLGCIQGISESIMSIPDFELHDLHPEFAIPTSSSQVDRSRTEPLEDVYDR